jgi:uncharacterized protein
MTAPPADQPRPGPPAHGTAATAPDEPAILELNRRDEQATSPLDPARLRALLDRAFHVGLRDGGRTAVLLAFAEDAGYDNPNFAWFAARHRRFVYVDRVIVAAHARGRGLAAGLYAELFRAAAASGRAIVGCEVNLDPPNPVSDAVHARLGFREAGRMRLANGKLVRYLERDLARLP